MKRLLVGAICSMMLCGCVTRPVEPETFIVDERAADIQVGALSFEEYLPLLEGKRVSVLSNQTGMVSPTSHLLDTRQRGFHHVSRTWFPRRCRCG